MKTTVIVNMKPVNAILARLGVDKNGDVQKFVTMIVNKRITRYMPCRTGVLSTKLKYIKSPTEIEVLGPYARYQYQRQGYGQRRHRERPRFYPGCRLPLQERNDPAGD